MREKCRPHVQAVLCVCESLNEYQSTLNKKYITFIVEPFSQYRLIIYVVRHLAPWIPVIAEIFRMSRELVVVWVVLENLVSNLYPLKDERNSIYTRLSLEFMFIILYILFIYFTWLYFKNVSEILFTFIGCTTITRDYKTRPDFMTEKKTPVKDFHKINQCDL